MRWFGHVEHSTGWIAKVRKLNVVVQKRPGRPKKTWDEVLVDDRKKLGMDFADPMSRSERRGGPPRGFGDLGRRAIYFQGAGEHC